MKVKRPFQHFDLVEVVWNDAAGIRHGWAAKSETLDPYLALSVGFLIQETPEHIRIAQDTDAEGSHNGRTQIPLGMVKRMRVLRKRTNKSPMVARKVEDSEILQSWESCPSATDLSRLYKMSLRSMQNRIASLRASGQFLPSPDRRSPQFGKELEKLNTHPAAINLGIEDGEVLIGSDCHYWPGVVSTAHRAFVEMVKDRKPKVIIKNGDVADFPQISRHAPIGWESRPKLSEEVDNLKAMLSEVEKASPESRRIWPLGNHDARFETRLATQAPEYANVHGVHLKDNFPNWEACWAVFVNSDTVVKHRMKGGIHATRNNTLNAGRTMVTGHLHSLKVTPLTDFNGTRWGVDCGTMADPYGPQFYNYTELNPVDWRSGFILLTFKNGKMMWPEHIWVSGPGIVQFRGKEWRV